LLLDGQRRLGVADFGIARLAEESSVTLTGQVLGTAAYLAPEQKAGEGATSASDRYALAVVAHELLTGRRPSAGEDSGELSAATRGVLDRGLAKDPGARWESATAFAEALAGAAGEEEPPAVTRPRPPPTPVEPPTAPRPLAPSPAAAKRPAPPPPPPSPPALRRRGDSRRWLPVALVGVLAALVAVLALASGGGSPEPVTRSAASVPEPAPAGGAGREEPGEPEQPAPATGASVSQLNDQGFALMNQERYDEAIPPLQQAVERCGDSRETVCAYALFNLGRSLRLAGRPDEAIPILERRLGYDTQTEAVQAELDAARRAAGEATSAAPPGADHSREEENGNGKGKGKDREKGDD
ncbi:MAG TPA: tetratricopeptide repeat-containing protein kinase family protein, partial [Solirubrobacteraceae bacterium]|nr:tetratricopeptide repeat-containing protein kinase family protein [Solirubrobacteraceae bacterium]